MAAAAKKKALVFSQEQNDYEISFHELHRNNPHWNTKEWSTKYPTTTVIKWDRETSDHKTKRTPDTNNHCTDWDSSNVIDMEDTLF